MMADRPRTAMQFGMAMSAFITSATFHTTELRLETAALPAASPTIMQPQNTNSRNAM